MAFVMRGDHGDIELCWRRDLHRLNKQSASALLRASAAGAGSLHALRGILAEGPASVAVDRLDDNALIDAVAAQIESGQLIAFSKRAGSGVWVERVQAEPPPAPAEPVLRGPADTTWVEFELVGEDGEPVPGVRYEVTLPDGTVREGRLNYRGLARFDGIEQPGQCSISFPDLDQDAWESL